MSSAFSAPTEIENVIPIQWDNIELDIEDGKSNKVVGTDGPDSFVGSAGDDVLIGKGGDDTLDGGLGNDIVRGGAGNDHLLGSDGNDNLMGNGGNDILQGGDGDDTLDGGIGNDTIEGGLGQDHMTGYKGSEVFVFNSTDESTVDAPDSILSSHLDDDKIDLSGIDANINVDGDQAFVVVQNFTGQAGQLELIFNPTKEVTEVLGDVDGDGVADFEIDVAGHKSNFDGFIL